MWSRKPCHCPSLGSLCSYNSCKFSRNPRTFTWWRMPPMILDHSSKLPRIGASPLGCPAAYQERAIVRSAPTSSSRFSRVHLFRFEILKPERCHGCASLASKRIQYARLGTSSPVLILLPVITNTVCWGRSIVLLWPKIRSDQTEEVTARDKLGESNLAARLSRMLSGYPADKMAVNSFRSSSSSRVGAGCITALVPVIMRSEE